MTGALRRDALPALWALVLALVVLGPALGPGYVLVRDMVWVPDLAMRPDFLGLGSALPRAVPSDGVIAVLDGLVPGMVLQKTVLVLSLSAGGVGATRLLGDGVGLVERLVVVSAYGWNALVFERLLMGAWPVLVGYAVLPWVLHGATRWSEEGRLPASLLVLVPLGCLSPAAGLATAVGLLSGVGARWRRAVTLLVAANAPWAVAGALHLGTATSDPRGAAVFALHGEGAVPGPLAALTLGGIWNSDVVPATRQGALGWVGLVVVVALAVLGLRRWWPRATRIRRPLVTCWVVGWGLAVLTWLAPDVFGYAAARVPGAGVVRDGARSLVLCAPLLAVLVAEGVRGLVPHTRGGRIGLGVAGVLLPVALLPDLALGAGGRLTPVDYPPAFAQARAALDAVAGDVLVLPLSSYRAPAWNGGRPVLDPLGRYLSQDYVASDVLVVDGVALSGEDPRVVAAAQALERPTPASRAEGLGDLGIGAVVTDRTAPEVLGPVPEVAGDRVLDGDVEVLVLTDVDVRPDPVAYLVAVGLAWTGFGGLVAAWIVAAARTRQRGRL